MPTSNLCKLLYTYEFQGAIQQENGPHVDQFSGVSRDDMKQLICYPSERCKKPTGRKKISLTPGNECECIRFFLTSKCLFDFQTSIF